MPRVLPFPIIDRLNASTARADLEAAVHVDVDWGQQELFFRREVAKVLGRYTDPTENFREVFHLLSELLGLNRGRLYLLDAALDSLVLSHAYGITKEEMARGVLARSEGVTGQAFESGQLLHCLY